MDGWMDGWKTCNCTSFSTVFQSYQDEKGDENERLCAMEPCLKLEDFASSRAQIRDR